MSIFTSLKKQDLVKALTAVGVKALSKDTKPALVAKCTEYADTHGDAGAAKLAAALADEEDDDDVVTLAEEEEEETIGNAELADDDDDLDYNGPPPVDLKLFIADPIIEKWENLVDRVYEVTDCVGITVLNHSDKLRDDLLSVVTLNYVELVVEVLTYLWVFVPWVPLADNTLNVQLLQDNIPYLARSGIPSPQVLAFVLCRAVLALVVWALTLVALPLVALYYVNFTTRILTFEGLDLVGRVHDFDPFVFALTKAVAYYFVANNGIQQLFTHQGITWAVANKVLIELGHYAKFTAHLGLVPLVLGVANVAVALYSQFEH